MDMPLPESDIAILKRQMSELEIKILNLESKNSQMESAIHRIESENRRRR